MHRVSLEYRMLTTSRVSREKAQLEWEAGSRAEFHCLRTTKDFTHQARKLSYPTYMNQTLLILGSVSFFGSKITVALRVKSFQDS